MRLRYLLDTSIVSVPAQPNPDPALLAKLNEFSASCAIASLTWHELSFGCLRLPAGRRRKSLQNYLQEVVRKTLLILPYEEAAATWHAEERARLEAIGRPLPFVDGQIAAIAKVNSLILVTANEKDFRPFHGLNVENWLKPTKHKGAN